MRRRRRRRPTRSRKKTEEINPQDQWLEDCYAGKGRPKWTSRMIAPLEKMLKAERRRRNGWRRRWRWCRWAKPPPPAGRARHGADEPRSDRTRRRQCCPGWCGSSGSRCFETCYALAGDGESRSQLITALAEAPDRRAAEPLWELLADPKVSRRGIALRSTWR